MKITTLEMANVKRVKALRMEPSADGLTIIGGKNGQGKTSVLDAIAYALGGERYKPSKLKRDGAVGDAFIHIEMDNGLIIDRKGVNSSLTVTDATGKRAGQALLDELVSKLALDLPKFINATSAEKAKTLLGILGIGDTLAKLEREEKSKYDNRTAIGRLRDTKKKAAEDMPWHEDAPATALLVSDLIKEQQEILARNGMRVKNRQNIEQFEAKLKLAHERKEELRAQIERMDRNIAQLTVDIEEAKKADAPLESTDEIKAKIEEYEAINQKVRTNKDRAEKMAEAEELNTEYTNLSNEIEEVRKQRIALLDSADLPLPGLSIENGELLYNGAKWDCMSGSQQLIVACAIVSKLNPDCRFVLMDKLEQLDLDTLADFDAWLKEHDLQCLATRVSTGGECQIVIDDGEAVNAESEPVIDDEY